MNLENYWKILAKYSEEYKGFVFFNNGFIGVKNYFDFVLYDENGKVFVSGDNATNFCTPFQLYENGYLSYTLLDEEAIYDSLFEQSHPVSLGRNILTIVSGPNGLLAFQQRVRNYKFWYLCELKDGELVKSESLSGVQNISFFANGSYVVYYNNKNIRVFNRRRHQIFSCNWEHTSFSKVGRNHFLAASGKKYKGIYSAYDGKLVLENRRIDLFWENGVYYVQEIGVYSPKQKDFFKLQEIYDEYVVGESLFCFNHRGGTFVIDTNLTLAELRKKAADELHKSSADEAYSAYLVRLLNLLY